MKLMIFDSEKVLIIYKSNWSAIEGLVDCVDYVIPPSD